MVRRVWSRREQLRTLRGCVHSVRQIAIDMARKPIAITPRKRRKPRKGCVYICPEQLKYWRTERGFSQPELSRAARVPQPTLAKHEAADPNAPRTIQWQALSRLARVLNLHHEQLQPGGAESRLRRRQLLYRKCNADASPAHFGLDQAIAASMFTKGADRPLTSGERAKISDQLAAGWDAAEDQTAVLETLVDRIPDMTPERLSLLEQALDRTAWRMALGVDLGAIADVRGDIIYDRKRFEADYDESQRFMHHMSEALKIAIPEGFPPTREGLDALAKFLGEGINDQLPTAPAIRGRKRGRVW